MGPRVKESRVRVWKVPRVWVGLILRALGFKPKYKGWFGQLRVDRGLGV